MHSYTVFFPISGVRLTRTFKNCPKKIMFFVHEKNAKIDGNRKVSTHFLIKHECKIMYAHFHGRCTYISLPFTISLNVSVFTYLPLPFLLSGMELHDWFKFEISIAPIVLFRTIKRLCYTSAIVHNIVYLNTYFVHTVL